MTDEPKVDNRYTVKAPVRMLLGNVVEPRKVGAKGKEKGDPIYSILVGLTEGEDLDGLKGTALRVAKANFPGRAIQNPNAPIDRNAIQLPFSLPSVAAEKAKKNGKDGAIYEGYKYLFKSTSGQEYPPALAVINPDGSIRALEGQQRSVEGKNKFYNGCFVGLAVSFKPYWSGSEGGVGEFTGVKAFISAVLFAKDGTRIGGSAVETFRHFAGAVTTENPLEDEVSF